MMPKKPFEELVLAEREKERRKYGAALAGERGDAPYSKTMSEAEQDRQWAFARPELTDPPEVTILMQTRVAQYRGAGADPDAAIQSAVLDVVKSFPQSAFLMLMVPKEMGGGGLTPLRASYTKYPYRERIVQAAGKDIEDQVKEADHRRERMMRAPAEPPAVDVEQPRQATPAEPETGNGGTVLMRGKQ